MIELTSLSEKELICRIATINTDQMGAAHDFLQAKALFDRKCDAHKEEQDKIYEEIKRRL